MSNNPSKLSFLEKVAYGCGNLFPTAVTATGGMAMYFYTDIVGLSAALIGTVLLLVRLSDAVWDIFVGRWVDRTRTRYGQCRPFLMFAAPLMALAFIGAFTMPPVEGPTAKLIWVVVAYTLLWWCYSAVMIPFQSMPALVAPDPDERLRLLGVNSFLMFICVVGCGAGFPIVKDILSVTGPGTPPNPAQGFLHAALIFGIAGMLLTWVCAFGTRERVKAGAVVAPDLKADLGALWANRGWRVCLVAFALLALLIGLPLAAGVYYFAAALKAPQLIGPFMGLSGIGLMVGVVLSDRLTRRYCKKRVLVASSVAGGLLFMLYLLFMSGPVPAVMALALLTNISLGIGAPITQSLLSDTADAIERDTGRRVVGTLFATVNFTQKIGAGAASAVVGVVLSMAGYIAGRPEQPAEALWGIALLMGPVSGTVALAFAALIGWGYPMGRAEVAQLRDELAARRAAMA
jgi:GPH family glycoside/pentoside/hexuronide:cation symporter